MGIHRLAAEGDAETGFEPSDLVPAAAFTTGDQTELVHYAHLNEETGISAGTWKCAPTKEVIDAYPCDEMMTILGGSVTITGKDGDAQTFTAGDTFFISKGTPLTWEITETLLKFFMISE